ncbi:hypothetical protein F4778DRAFT_717589 [Xylariomycetidae sp. FL2044]|nr:hypothetical protein F4778DRAFT_717589 [Xylariomycetidae sp. FL2044]
MLTYALRRTTPQSNLVRYNASSIHDVLVPAGQHRQHVRTFRFGMWSSYLDPELHNELRRRHRMAKYKYTEMINRRLRWDQVNIGEDPKVALRRIISRYWNPAQARCVSRYVNQDELDSRRYRPSEANASEAVRPKKSHTPDSSKHRAKGNLRGSKRDGFANPHSCEEIEKEIQKARDSLQQDSLRWCQSEKTRRTQSASTDQEYVFDPITNRKVKVEKNTSSTDTTAKDKPSTFKSYRSQFITFAPPKLQEEEVSTSSNHSQPVEPKHSSEASVSQHPASGIPEGKLVQSAEKNNSPGHAATPPNEEYSLNHLPLEESEESYDNLQKNQSSEANDVFGKSVEGPLRDPDLDKYRYTEFDKVVDNDKELPDNLEELKKYKPYMYNEEKPVPSISQDDLGFYNSSGYREDMKDVDTTTGQPRTDWPEAVADCDPSSPHDMRRQYEDLNKYNIREFEDPVVEDSAFGEYGDLEKYKAFRYLEPDGAPALERDIVAESLKEFDDRFPRGKMDDGWRDRLARKFEKLDLDTDSTSPASSPESLTTQADDKSHAESSANSTFHTTERQAKAFMTSSETVSEGEDEAPKLGRRPLTGNFLRDFPEEFSGSWTILTQNGEPRSVQQPAPPTSRKVGDETSGSQNATKSSRLEPALDRRKRDPRLESALNRHLRDDKRTDPPLRTQSDPSMDHYSMKPQGLETSYADECGGVGSSPVFTKTYSAEPGQVVRKPKCAEEDSPKEAQPSAKSEPYPRDPEIDGLPAGFFTNPTTEPDSSKKVEPTVYRILAYDSTMQSIGSAETTSIVPDQATPLTPTEVLLRLSNPSKFFPHFAPLQAQGFEIVSGGGDVLVFRQVRPAKLQSKGGAAQVNPIDMMGRPTPLPNAAAFASPTGFLNYDVPSVEEPQAPQFKSNIDVRREEPVFSGPKPSASERKPKRKRPGPFKRVLVGGVSAGGIAYAIGEVSEYFRTGGSDGKGPTGF